MDELFLAEFHGFIDEKTWEIAKLSINYLQTLNLCVIKVVEKNGIIENYSKLRDIIEIIRICVLHGILIDYTLCKSEQCINKNDKSVNNSLFHFVKLFPDLDNIGNIDDMCFLAFLLINKAFTGFLHTINNPVSKWNEKISIYYHHASILRYDEFLKEFIRIVNHFENNLKIKNFHIPNNWLGYFAKLSLRWNNFDNDDGEITILKNKNKENKTNSNFISSEKKELFNKNNLEQKSSLVYLLKKEFENAHDSYLFDSKLSSSKSSIDSENTYITEINSINDIENNKIENIISIVYDEKNIQDLEELLEHMWSPVFETHKFLKNNSFENQEELYEINDIEIENLEDHKCIKELFNSYFEESKTENTLRIDKNIPKNVRDKKDLINLRIHTTDIKDRYLYYYNLPLNKEEEILILNLQNNKCFNITCCNLLEHNRKLKFCCFTGYFYCDDCFGDDSCSILPGLLAKYGNLTAVPVSINSKNELEKLKNLPLININSLTAELWTSNKQLKQLVHLKMYLSSLWDNDELQDFVQNDVNLMENKPKDTNLIGNIAKCQYKESIKKRLIREYKINNRYGRYDYFSINELTEIAYEFFSQDVVMCSSETSIHQLVRELTEIAIHWKKHFSKCIYCQFRK